MSKDSKSRRTVLQGLAAAGTIAGVGGIVNAQEGADSGAADLSVDPATAGETATYTLTVTIGDDNDGDSLNDLVCEFQAADVDVSEVGVGDVSLTLEGEDVTDDVDELDRDDGTVSVGFGGNYSLSSGDELQCVVENVGNPTEAGEYEATVVTNSQSAAQTNSVSVTIEDGGGSGNEDGDEDGTGSDEDCEDEQEQKPDDEDCEDETESGDGADEDFDSDGETIEDGEEVDEDDD